MTPICLTMLTCLSKAKPARRRASRANPEPESPTQARTARSIRSEEMRDEHEAMLFEATSPHQSGRQGNPEAGGLLGYMYVIYSISRANLMYL